LFFSYYEINVDHMPSSNANLVLFDTADQKIGPR